RRRGAIRERTNLDPRADSIPCRERGRPRRRRGGSVAPPPAAAPLVGTRLAQLLAQLIALVRRHPLPAAIGVAAATPLLLLLPQLAPEPIALVGAHACAGERLREHRCGPQRQHPGRQRLRDAAS